VIKPFLAVMTLLFLSAGLVLIHYLGHGWKTQERSLQQMSRLVNFSSPALSVAYYAPRVLFYEEAKNPAYPQMQAINKMDLVYEK